MTIPRRADMASGDPCASRQTRLLAELPHIGDAAALTPVVASANNQDSTHPAFAKHSDQSPERTDTLAYRRSTRYVDQAHIDDESDHTSVHRHEKRRRANQTPAYRQEHTRYRSRSKSALGGLLTDAHQQMAPFAGLIVTAALIAAAGLLFHMMAGGKNATADLNEFALPGFQVEILEKAPRSDTSAPVAEVSLAPATSDSAILDSAPAIVGPEENREQEATPAVIDVAKAPAANEEIEPTLPLGQLSFPQTETPLALDYTKASDPDLQELPEIAERTDTTASENINR